MTEKDFASEFVCLKNLMALRHKNNRTDLFVNVTSRNGKGFSQLMKTADERGLLNEDSPEYIGTKKEISAYMGGSGTCMDACNRLRIDSRLLKHMCAVCRYGTDNTNDRIEDEKKVLAALYNGILKLPDEKDPRKVFKAERNYFVCSEGLIECLSVDFGAALCSIFLKNTLKITKERDLDARNTANRILSAKHAFRRIPAGKKEEISRDLSAFFEGIFGQRISEEEAQRAYANLMAPPRMKSRTRRDLAYSAESGFAISPQLMTQESSRMATGKPASGEPETSETELTADTAREESQKTQSGSKAPEIEGKTPEPAHEINIKALNIKDAETETEEKNKNLTIKAAQFDPGLGLIIRGDRRILKAKRPELRQLLDIISCSRFISLDVANLDDEDGLLVYEKTRLRCPVFISSEYYDHYLFKELLNSCSFTALTLNLELLMEKARLYAVENAEYVYSLRSAYKVIEPSDNRLYPVEEICEFMGGTYHDFISDLFVRYEDIFGKLHFKVLEKKADRLRKSIQNYEMVLASANDIRWRFECKSTNLLRRDFIKNEFAYHRGIRKRAGGSVVKIENRWDGNTKYNNEGFNRVLLKKVFGNEHYRNMDLALMAMDDDCISIFINSENRQVLDSFQGLLTAASLSSHNLLGREGVLTSYIEIE